MQLQDNRKRIIKRYEALTKEEATLFQQTYPDGQLRGIETLTKADGQTFHAVRMENETTVYLVKVELPEQTTIETEDDYIEEEDPIMSGRFSPFNEASDVADADAELSENADDDE